MSGFVQSGRFSTAFNLLRSGVAWWDAADGSVYGQKLVNRGSGGSALDAQLGSVATGGLTVNSGYIYLPGVAGNYLSVPDAANLDTITTDATFHWAGALNDYSDGNEQALVVRFVTGGARPWRFYQGTVGNSLNLQWSPDGPTLITATSTTGHTIPDGTGGHLACTMDADDGGVYKVRFWQSLDDPTVATPTWTQVGSTITGGSTTGFCASADAIEIGTRAGGATNFATGRHQRARVYASIGASGTPATSSPLVDINCATDYTDTDIASFTATTGQTVTINRTGADSNDPLWLPRSSAGTNYAYFTGATAEFLTMPDDSGFTPATALSYREVRACDSWNTGASQYFGGHYHTVANNRSWAAGLSSAGRPSLTLSADGISAAVISATATPTVLAGGILAVRCDWEAATPRCVFYTKATTAATAYADALDDSGWTQVGTPVTASVPATLFNSSTTFTWGTISGNAGAAGKGYATVIKVDGVLVAGINMATDCTSADATSFTATSGQTITVSRSTSGRKLALVTRPIYLFGTNDYMEVADSDLLDFGASDSFTAWVLVRQWATPVSNGRYMNKRASTGAGWLLQASGTAQQGLFYFESTGAVQNITAATSAGDLRLYAGIRDAVADTIGSALNGTITTPTTDTTTGSLANASTLRIGCRSDSVNNVQDFEFLAAGVFRRALTAADLTTIVNFYGAA